MSAQLALIGNPNCGKTSLFNRLTGASQRVGNWSGVTVERREGRYRHGGREFPVVDLPGIYSLDAPGDDAGLDAQIALEHLLGGEPELVVNVVDGSNLERNLYLTAQLLELGLPIVVALTMCDVPAARRRPVDADELSARLGCPVVKVNARRGGGVERLREAIAAGPADPARGPAYPPAVELAVEALSAPLGLSRSHALALLSGDVEPHGERQRTAAIEQRERLERSVGEDVDIVLADARYGFVRERAPAVPPPAGGRGAAAPDRLDRVLLNRWLGIPIFLAAMYLLFMITINVGGAFIEFFDIAAGALFVDGPRTVLESAGSPEWITVLVTGAGAGIQTVATFIPIVGVLFLFLCALEDSGYMARAAFVMDRVMRAIGLPGKSVVPLLLGFGCNVPAVLSTRTLESRRDRLITIMMSPFMSCGARLPVYALFAVVFFPDSGQNAVFALYLIGMAAAVFTGLVLKWTLLRGEATAFVLELPAYHVPNPRSLVLHTWERLRGFVLGAGKIIVSMVVVLTVLGSIMIGGGPDGRQSVLDGASRAVTPALAPLGIEQDNWPATVGIVTGLFAKEALVGTLDSLYGSLADEGADDEPFSLGGELSAAVASVGANLKGLGDKIANPLGISLTGKASREAAAAEQGVATGTFTQLQRLFDGAAGAFAYLLFVLLYFPCAAATGAIYRETTLGWTVFAGLWTTGLAYAASIAFYQAATFGRHPESSATWIGFVVMALLGTIAAMRVAGSRPRDPSLAGRAEPALEGRAP
jgi:ferrous iron transport protein B